MKSKVCYILSYRAPNYVRTTSLINALSRLKNIELFQARNKSKGLIRYFETFFNFLKIRFKVNPDIYIIGFRGHEIYWLYRIFGLRKKFVFDAMMSPYDSLVNEKKTLQKNSLLAKIIYFLERSILRNAEYVLTDTNLHASFFAKTFGIDKKKIKVIPVGTDEGMFDMEKTKEINLGEEFTLFFYGTFLPLHGIDVILKAAKLLEKYPIKFIIAGGRGNKKALKEFRDEVENLSLKNVEYFEWIEFDKLPQYIKSADLCLGGAFGGTPQARRVITGKTCQFLQMGRPTVIGKIDEEVGFMDKKNCLLVEQGDAQDLADSILWAYENREKLDNIGKQGRELFKERFTHDRLKDKFDFLNKT